MLALSEPGRICVLFATELMAAAVYDPQSHFVGRVREFFVEPADQPNRVSHFLISRGRFQPLIARYDQIEKVAPGRIDLNVSERALEAYKPNEGLLAVRKDLLDQQIIDTEGRMWDCRARCGGCCRGLLLRRSFVNSKPSCHNVRFGGSS
jgi:hypothetical protein